MYHYQLCKYDKKDKAFQQEWTSLEGLLSSSGNTEANALPAEYSSVEMRYLTTAGRLICDLSTGENTVRAVSPIANFNDADLREVPGLELALRTSFYGRASAHAISGLEFSKSIDLIDAVFLIQLGLRNLCSACIEIGESRLMVVDDFYMIATVPENYDIGSIVGDQLYVYSTMDPFA